MIASRIEVRFLIAIVSHYLFVSNVASFGEIILHFEASFENLEPYFNSRSRHAFVADARMGLQGRRAGNYLAIRFTSLRDTAALFHVFGNITR